MRRLLIIATTGGAVLTLAACANTPPTNGTAVARANRSILATFNAPVGTNRTARVGAPKPAATASATLSVVAPTPTATPDPAATRQRLIAAEANLDTGEFVTTITYDDEARTMSTVRFDLGHRVGVSRTRSTITYQSAVATRSLEVITIGIQAWQRIEGGPWGTTDRSDSAQAQILGLLPHADTTASVSVEGEGDTAVMRWYDSARASDVQVEIDAATGVPRQMQRRSRADGSLLTVTYRAWNTPVAINAPDGA